MNYLKLVLAIAAVAAANVDVVDTDLGLCVGWIDGSGAWIRNVDESVTAQFSGEYDHITLARGFDPGGADILVSLSAIESDIPDSLLKLETLTMNVLSACEITPDSLIEDASAAELHTLCLNRYDRGMGRQMAATMGAYTSTLCDIWITESIIEEDLNVLTTSQYSLLGACLSYPQITAPVNLLGGMFGINRSYNYFSGEYDHWIVSLTYDLPVDDGKDTPLFQYTVYSETNMDPDYAGIVAAGSDLSSTVLLWTDSGMENLYSSIFIDDVQPWSTDPFPWAHPMDDPAAMSCHPYFDGALLAWVQGSELLCRHFDGCWNDYQHSVQTGLGSVSDGDIAVCSVADGYWIAWLEVTKAEPQLAYVPRDSVTGIEGSEVPETFALMAGPNPFNRLLRVRVNGFEGSCPISIYDSVGRMVETGILTSGEYCWDGGDYPAGVYSVVAMLPQGSVIRLVVRTGNP